MVFGLHMLLYTYFLLSRFTCIWTGLTISLAHDVYIIFATLDFVHDVILFLRQGRFKSFTDWKSKVHHYYA